MFTAGDEMRVRFHPERPRGWFAAAYGFAAALLLGAAAQTAGAQQSVADYVARDTGVTLLDDNRIIRLPARERSAWSAYVASSRRLHAADTVAMGAELRTVGASAMVKAPYAAPDFRVAVEKSDAWFHGDSAMTLASAVLTFQTPSGGWSKRTDMRAPRATGMSYYSETEEWHYIPTLDNGSTTGQLAFLARVAAAHPDARVASAYHRGVAYLIAAQEPNGCWPQTYPLEGGYHDAVTFNDDATVLVLRTLDAVSSGAVAIATPDERANAAASARRGVRCLVNTQVTVKGQRTIWGQQHDPISLEPVAARRYEIVGLAGRESATVMTYLMSLDAPDASVVDAVHAAAVWFRTNALMGYHYDGATGFRPEPGAGPIWARLSEIGSNRPIFANRDGIKRYDWNQLTDRRTGYGWFGTEPAAALRQYDDWSRSHPSMVAKQDKRPWSIRLAESVMQRDSVVHPKWDYVAGVILLGIHRISERTGDARYAKYVKANIDRLVHADGTIESYKMDEFNQDAINEGKLLFPLYARTHDERYKKAMATLREQLRQQPRTTEGGFWHKKIYPGQMWLDGLYMAEPFYAQYAREFNEPAAFDDVTKQFLLTARHTRDPRSGLMYHGWDETHKQVWADSLTGLSQNFWGRAMGWYAMALVDALDFIPANHKDRAELIRILRDVAQAVRDVQDPVSGLWYDILDQPNRAGNYHEASASSMFVYALAKGARKGYLAADYRDVASRGFDGIIRELVTVDPKGLVSLTGIVSVSGLGGPQNRNGSFAYYMSEPVVSNDFKGVGPLILAAEELGR
ncbi:MAG: pectate lyase [bacterium]